MGTVTLYVPSLYAVRTRTGVRWEWHALVDVIDEHAEGLRHLVIWRRRYGNRMPWLVCRAATCPTAADNIRRVGKEFCWRDTPVAVRHLVLQDLGLVEYRAGLLQ